jgi:serine/threonine protein kinase
VVFPDPALTPPALDSILWRARPKRVCWRHDREDARDRAGGALPHIGREVAKALAVMHCAGVVHRDLKPETVLITPEHQVKIMDLGVARLVEAAFRLSRSGAFLGSVLYAAPEQFGGAAADGRADLFSLGVLLYEPAGGAHPLLRRPRSLGGAVHGGRPGASARGGIDREAGSSNSMVGEKPVQGAETAHGARQRGEVTVQ